MIRRPPRSTLDRSSAASDVYKRQAFSDTLYAEVGLDAYFVDNWLATDDADANEWAIDLSLIHISEPTRPY